MAGPRRNKPPEPQQEPRAGLVALLVYLIVLVIGVAAELLDIQWIRDLPIY